jgi:hypothetical protein
MDESSARIYSYVSQFEDRHFHFGHGVHCPRGDTNGGAVPYKRRRRAWCLQGKKGIDSIHEDGTNRHANPK